MEQKIKAMLGDFMFMIISLQHQLDILQKENEELKNQIENIKAESK